jgi:DNA recombination-dependent growth factor C
LSKEEELEVRVEVHALNGLADLGKFKTATFVPSFSNSFVNLLTCQKPIVLDAASTLKNCSNSRVSRFLSSFSVSSFSFRQEINITITNWVTWHGTAT